MKPFARAALATAFLALAIAPVTAETLSATALDSNMSAAPPMVFRVGGREIGPRIPAVRIDLAERPSDVRRSHTTADGRSIHETVFSFADGGQVAVEAETSRRGSGATIHIRWTRARLASVWMPIEHADRLVFRQGDLFGSRPLLALTEPVEGGGRRLAAQSAISQEGLLIEASSETAGLRALQREGVAGVEVAMPGAGAPGGEGLATIRIDAFRGDAALALERGRGPGAGEGTALSEAGHGLGEGAMGFDNGKEGGWSLWFGPRKRVFKPLLADPREAQVRVTFMTDRKGESFFDFGVGSDLGVWYRQGLWSEDDEMSIGLRGLVYSRLKLFTENFDLQNIDYRGGLATGYRHGKHSGELLIYHQSSHLGDEPLDFGQRERIDYSIEAAQALYAYTTGPWRFYGGPEFLFGRAYPRELSNNWNFRLGAERRFAWLDRPWYVAVDTHMKEENNWRPNATGQIGFELGGTGWRVNPPRLFLEIYDGYSNMGQFYNEREQYYMIGMGYNF